uniref:Uncharacterized protein n=1 Tax=Oryza punctata TaxID=4537 RepID=A0A0E0JTK2_ORYPU
MCWNQSTVGVMSGRRLKVACSSLFPRESYQKSELLAPRMRKGFGCERDITSWPITMSKERMKDIRNIYEDMVHTYKNEEDALHASIGLGTVGSRGHRPVDSHSAMYVPINIGFGRLVSRLANKPSD